ncbi:hypothetical protein H0H87_012866 [Tephrocybe sp. NHM501043]|nr:hypothetical protein H0H87_012866 [Tephrocybe sp. NHM501043]
MANPRQRRKARSSSHRPVSHSRHAKKNLKKMPPIRGPKVLQEAWDKTKTVRQNYITLGLIHDLNPSAAGGAEPMEEEQSQTEESQIASTSQLEQPNPIRKGFGKIIRDEAGNVLRFELAEEEDEPRAEKQHDEEMGEPEVDGTVLGPWVTDLGGNEKIKLSSGETNVVQGIKHASHVAGDDDGVRGVTLVDQWWTGIMQLAASGTFSRFVRAFARDRGGFLRFFVHLITGYFFHLLTTHGLPALERISSVVQQNGTTLGLSDGSGPRHTSSGELGYLTRLVGKYGDDVEKMARDRRLNVEQRTAGALRRALKKAGLAGRS